MLRVEERIREWYSRDPLARDRIAQRLVDYPLAQVYDWNARRFQSRPTTQAIDIESCTSLVPPKVRDSSYGQDNLELGRKKNS